MKLTVFAAVLAAMLLVSPKPAAEAVSTTPDFSFESDQADALLGNFVAGAGDVNDDGYADVLVTAPDFDNGELDEGRVYLFLGGPTGLQAVPAWTFEPDQADAGLRATRAGDVDGDGFDDAIVRAASFDDDQVDEGRVWIFRGGASGLETSPFWTVDGNQASSFFGGAIAGVGDVNGDGFGDVMVGAGGFDNDLVNEGAAFLYFGSPAGPPTTADWMVEGDQADSAFGRVAAAGDVNADGYDDFLIGAPFFDDGQQDEGVVYLYTGSRNGPRKKVTKFSIDEPSALLGNYSGSAGDVNGDGFDDIVIGALGLGGSGVTPRVFLFLGQRPTLSTTPDQVLQTTQANTQFGLQLGAAGDVNGDGLDDLVVGARLFDVTFTNQGRVFIYLGSATGYGAAAAQTLDGSQAFEEFGVSSAVAGDVNGDGFDDVLVGAHAYDNPESNEGRAVAFHGGP